MNLLLLWPDEIAADGSIRLRDYRAQHLLNVLRAEVGQTLVAGCANTSIGTATVLERSDTSVLVQYDARHQVEETQPRCLLLAIPRPKVLSRCLEHAAALGYTKIGLFRCYRVEKAHLGSHKLAEEDMRRHVLHGIEQARRVTVPEVRVFGRFNPFVQDVLPTWVPDAHRFVAHPTATKALSEQSLNGAGFSLAVGPEGGFIPYEVQQFEALGFTAISAGEAPLRVESALSYLTAQLDLLAAVHPRLNRAKTH